MVEGLALAASIAAILQITNSIISICHGDGAAAIDAPWELAKVNAEMKSLRSVLQTLQPLAEQAEFASPSAGTRLPTLALLCGPRGLLNCCLDEVRRLDEQLKNPSWSDSFGLEKKAFIQALRWPLNKVETTKALDDVSRYRNILNLAITADQTTLTLEIQKLSISTNDIVVGTQRDDCLIKDLASDMHADVQSTKSITLEREKIDWWLSAGGPDPSTNQIRASRSRQADTGLWFLQSETFTYWKASGALFWLHGKAGCGKTVLSSAIINAVLQEPQSKSEIAVAYFYFDFNDVAKQKSDKMIRSLITQLSRQSKKKLNKLEALFSFYDNGERQPDVEKLLIVLKEVVEGFDETICIQSSLVDADILTYVRGRLQNDRALKRWREKPQVQEEIETTLKEKANGMFRWAVCQLDALQNCLRLPMLRKALESLPETLDETYARILRNISEEDSHDAIKILQWLTYSSRPLRIEELAEIVAVNINDSPWFDHTARFPDQEDVLAICSSLVAVEDVRIEEDDSEYDKYLLQRQYGSTPLNRIQVVKLAHFSVKEYLVSKRIRDQAAATARYAIQEIQANQSIAAACLAYLLQFNQHDSLTSQTLEDFPLAGYAAKYWLRHTREVGKDLGPIEMLSQEFCLVLREAYNNWYRLDEPDGLELGFKLNREIARIATPLYYGSLAGVTELVQLLLKNGVDVNAQGGKYGSALQAASCGGHDSVVQLLLKNGADVNAQGGYYGNALQAASLDGHESVVQLLLKNKADVNAQDGFYGNALQAASLDGHESVGGYYGNALQAASLDGHESVVQLLLKNGADVNAQGGYYGNALQAASLDGHESVVQLLLKNKADVNAQDGFYGNALQAASLDGHESVVQLLLKNKADVNAQDGFYGNALQAASDGGHESVVQLLLRNGADVNDQGGYFGNALQAASYEGHESVVQLLLDDVADINAQGGQFGNALQAASCGGHESVVQLLLKNGVDVNAQGRQYGNALWASSYRGHKSVVQLLLKNEADVNAQGGEYGSALQAASLGGHESVVQLLLKNEADVNAHGGEYGSALQAASLEGHKSVVQLLLDNGADINAQGGQYGNALQAAFHGGHVSVVQLLLDNRADINAQGGQYRNALQAASHGGHESVVQLLLDNGADINAQGGWYGNALQAAIAEGCESVVQLLLKNGADIKAQGGFYGNALQAASCGGHESVVRLLLTNEVDVNAQGGYYGNALQAASRGGHDSMVQLLLDNGANINAQCGQYDNALQAASCGGHESVVQLLLKSWADVNAQGGVYGNALQAASINGHESVVQLLLKNEADVKA
ncbi:P-loop containing nucleoside triphosphate hydrolase [Lasallia pustulata]|uniref:p-loop containing nucleoside triphosphate hydrolase n=1 Tax=Lasallia pustulata TaxID=136370 RepID=A0A1W5D2P4_9LECA|nr:P-loop containing nucleoside triphosphate hydrolase [Lasallia pustulata]